VQRVAAARRSFSLARHVSRLGSFVVPLLDIADAVLVERSMWDAALATIDLTTELLDNVIALAKIGVWQPQGKGALSGFEAWSDRTWFASIVLEMAEVAAMVLWATDAATGCSPSSGGRCKALANAFGNVRGVKLVLDALRSGIWACDLDVDDDIVTAICLLSALCSLHMAWQRAKVAALA
jgi:hypothetical protein